LTEQSDLMGWEETLWAELEAMPDVQQLIASEEFVARIRVVSNLLARDRRLLTMRLVRDKVYTVAQLADLTGSTNVTIRRLVDEGRRIEKDEAEIAEAA
jgi:hypothetical protein